MHSHGLDLRGTGYHDGNHGDVPLGTDLRGWEWRRVHGPASTEVDDRPWAEGPSARVRVTASEAVCARASLAPPRSTYSAWGLRIPSSLGVGGAPRLLETSPFYARLEASFGDAHALGEVADFRRFHSPTVRWMATFRTRVGGAA